MDPIVHFELPVDDLQKARDFYGPIFGWNSPRLADAGRLDVRRHPHDAHR
jgi:predicted enzyme related to lactoylglutathione lyase